MKVKFAGNVEPCIVYNVISSGHMEYAEPLDKYCLHHNIEFLGMVPEELLVEATEHPDNTCAIDFAIEVGKEICKIKD